MKSNRNRMMYSIILCKTHMSLQFNLIGIHYNITKENMVEFHIQNIGINKYYFYKKCI